MRLALRGAGGVAVAVADAVVVVVDDDFPARGKSG